MKKIITPLVFGFFSICANAQQIDAETGNIVYTTLNPAPSGTPYTWNGFIVQNTGGGGFSGGNIPAYNPNTGTFIFGYNPGTVSYSTSVNYALAAAGTGLQINGFKYSWQYYNQDMSRGTLTGNISLTSSTGQTLQSFNYTMPQTTSGWTTMGGVQNFNTQYALSSVGNLNVSFTGKDDRWWAGYYGPQIRDINVKMLYSMQVPDYSSWIKLTDENGTFTLSKSGIVRYGANDTYIYKSYEAGTYECSNGAWGQDPLGGVYKSCSLGTNTTTSNPLPTTNTTTTTNATTTVINDITTAAAQPTTTTPTTTILETATSSTSGVTGPTPTATTTASSQTTSSSSSTSGSSTTASTPTTTSSTTTSSPSGGRTVDGTGIGLSVVSRNAQREQTIAMQAAQNAVTAAEQTAQQAQQEAVSVAQSSSAASNLNSVGSASRTNFSIQRSEQNVALSQTTQSSSFVSGFSLPGQQTNVSRSNDTNRLSLITNNLPEISNVQTATLGVAIQEQTTNNQSQTTFALLPPQQPQQTTTQTSSFFINETNQSKSVFSDTNQQTIAYANEVTTSETQKLLTDRTNPIGEIIEGRNIQLPTTTNVQQKTTVNTNVSDNEVAGGVNITRMATTPAGYNQYLNIVIADAAFYAPKEIYRGQRNVDNVRALRQMSSDRLHQEMVNQQYRRN
jgi:hypothetical protein